MDTASLKTFATSARVELIREVGARITAVLTQASPERVEQPRSVAALERAISAAGGDDKGKAHVAERVAYTWFNRIVALRFMDANGYTGIGIVSPAADQIGQPEILASAKRGQIDGDVVKDANAATIMGLLNGTRQPRPGVDAQAEAYTLLLADYCRFWNQAMPFMFEREGDFTELLIPANLLAEDSVLNRSVNVLTPDVCRDVEVIGWLYQYYISERKDEVFAGFKKNKKAGADEIPAATQLFTPHWIVRYLVENSVGRLWMLNRPESRLVDKMDYYIAPVDEETDFLKITRPEELTVIDPACGSGHMLTYAFDLLYMIYEEEGYTPSQIPGLILTHNLYGTEIDPRAGALAAFALTMKAVAKRKLFLKNAVAPNICVVEALSFRSDEIVVLTAEQGDALIDATYWNQFEHADTLGSLIRPDLSQTKFAKSALEQTHLEKDIIYSDTVDRARKVIRQAETLSNSYAVVVANPPYMGSKQMNGLLSQFMKDEYPSGKADLMTAFMLKSQAMTKPNGCWGMINLPSWMSLKSFERLRQDFLRNQQLVSMVHLGRGVFGSDFGSVAFIVTNARSSGGRAIYRRLFDQHVDVRSVATIEVLFHDRDYNRFEVAQTDFAAIPGSPIVYWLSEKMRGVWPAGVRLSTISEPRQGLITGDGESFVRLWWESSASRTSIASGSRSEAKASRARWFPYNKGGEFRKWYGNHEYLVNWEDDGRLVRNLGTEDGRARSRPQNVDFYFKPTISWSNVSSGSPAFRSFPAGFIAAGSTGDGIYPESEETSASLLGILNSAVAKAILAATSPTLTFNVGTIAALPVIQPDGDSAVVETVRRLVEQSREDWN